jgi:hypothetical protein
MQGALRLKDNLAALNSPEVPGFRKSTNHFRRLAHNLLMHQS